MKDGQGWLVDAPDTAKWVASVYFASSTMTTIG